MKGTERNWQDKLREGCGTGCMERREWRDRRSKRIEMEKIGMEEGRGKVLVLELGVMA